MDNPINPMELNELACYGALIERMQAIEGVSEVIEIGDLSEVQKSNRSVRRTGGAVYVVFDGFRPIGEADNGRNQAEEISFSFVLVKRDYKPSHSLYENDGIGETLTRIKRAFRGWDPVDAKGRNLVSKAFKQRQSLPIKYADKHGYFPIRFVAEVAS